MYCNIILVGKTNKKYLSGISSVFSYCDKDLLNKNKDLNLPYSFSNFDTLHKEINCYTDIEL